MKKKTSKLRSIVKKTPYVKPKPRTLKELKCHVCGEPATHVVLIELREKPGPPLKENNVLRVICKEHINLNFDYWVPYWAFKGLCTQWANEGITLNKQYCTIGILQLKSK